MSKVEDLATIAAPPARAHWTIYAGLGVLTTAVLVYGVGEQLYDTNFYVLWEATALLAGDHPYRDFFQWGSPLLTAISTLAQWLAGYRLIGEFVIHWLFIVAGVLMGFHLALRLSRSVGASVTTTLFVVALLAATPTFNFPKIFFYPVAVWVAWWYLDNPGVRRAATFGLITAIAFLYRHDHGVYIGVAAVATFILSRMAWPDTRSLKRSAHEMLIYLLVAAVVITPWAIVVHLNEGLIDYIETRSAWGRTWAPSQSPLLAIGNIDATTISVLQVSRDAAYWWLLQLTLVLPLLLIASALLDFVDAHARGRRAELNSYRALLAALFALFIGHRLFREPGYYVVTLPLTAAFAARLITAPLRNGRSFATGGWPRSLVAMLKAGQVLLIAAALVLTGLATLGAAADTDLLSSRELRRLRAAAVQLTISPPIDGFQSASDTEAVTPEAWLVLDPDVRHRMLIRYMHDCMAPSDRVFVTGSTPYQVGYYVERPIAGGHVQWHHGWRSDPEHEAQSAALLERQSVPFAFSTHDPILDDLVRYPRIREYFVRYYRELPGTAGLALVDTRRVPTRTYGAMALPCFR